MWQKWCAVIETHKWPHCFLTLSWLLTKSFCTFPAAALGSSCGCMASSAGTDLFNVTLSWFWPGQSSSSHSCGEGSGDWSHVYAARFIILFHAHLHWELWLWVEKKWTDMEPEPCCSLFQGSKVLGELVWWQGWGEQWSVQCRLCGQSTPSQRVCPSLSQCPRKTHVAGHSSIGLVRLPWAFLAYYHTLSYTCY